MKINRLIALLACTMAFTACQDDMQEASMQQNKIYTLTGKMSGGNAMSRAQIALGNNTSGNGEIAYWNEGDEFSLYQFNEYGYWNENVFTISSDYREIGQNTSASFTTETPVEPGSYVAVYPGYRTVFDGGYVTCQISNYTSYNFVDQNPDEVWKQYFNNNMFMLAKGTLSENDNEVDFKHLTSLFRITYTNVSEESQNVIAVLLGGDQHFRLWNQYSLEDGTIVNEGGITNDYCTWYEGLTVAPGNSADFYISSFPTAFDKGNMDITFIINKGDHDEYKTAKIAIADIASKNPNDIGFKAGKRYWFRITDFGRNICFDKDYTTDVVTIENPGLSLALKDVLENEYNIPVAIDEETGFATFNQVDANSVSELNFGYRGYNFTSLVGLEYFKNLKKLNVEGCGIKDTLKVPALSHLEELNVAGNDLVTDIVFPEMSTLKILNIAGMFNWATTHKIKELGTLYPNLISLNVHNNGLTSLDLSEFPNLEELICFDNYLQELDLSNRPKFRIVDCSNNETLTSLALQECTNLHKVAVQGCKSLASLNISNPEILKILLYSDTQVTFTKEQLENFTSVTRLGCGGSFNGSLDIPDGMKERLEYLECQDNNLAALDLSEYPKLNSLLCFRNQIDTLDISSLNNLYYLECGSQNNGIRLVLRTNDNQKQQWNENWKNWDINQGVYLEGEFSTKEIVIENKELSKVLYNYLGSSIVSLNSNGYAVMLEGDVLETITLDFGWNNVDSDGNREYIITSLAGIEHFKNLQTLYCNYSELLQCDLSQNTALKNVVLCGTLLDTLDLSALSNLEYVACSHSETLKNLILPDNEILNHIECQNTPIAVLNIHHPEVMTQLIYGGNSALNMDLSLFDKLTILGIMNMELKDLSIIPDTLKSKLTSLYLNENNLESLDLSKFSQLESLDCGGNKISTLDITPLGNLTSIWCGYQQDEINLKLTLTQAQADMLDENWISNNGLVTLNVIPNNN